jgi:hypothetical protein
MPNGNFTTLVVMKGRYEEAETTFKRLRAGDDEVCQTKTPWPRKIFTSLFNM